MLICFYLRGRIVLSENVDPREKWSTDVHRLSLSMCLSFCVRLCVCTLGCQELKKGLIKVNTLIPVIGERAGQCPEPSGLIGNCRFDPKVNCVYDSDCAAGQSTPLWSGTCMCVCARVSVCTYACRYKQYSWYKSLLWRHRIEMLLRGLRQGV